MISSPVECTYNPSGSSERILLAQDRKAPTGDDICNVFDKKILSQIKISRQLTNKKTNPLNWMLKLLNISLIAQYHITGYRVSVCTTDKQTINAEARRTMTKIVELGNQLPLYSRWHRPVLAHCCRLPHLEAGED